MNNYSDIEMKMSLFEDQKLHLNYIPIDLKKSFACYLTLNNKIMTPFIDINEFQKSLLYKFLFCNRNFWDFMWMKYVSVKPYEGTFEELRNEYLEAVKFYTLRVGETMDKIREKKLKYDIIYENAETINGIYVDYDFYKDKYKKIVYPDQPYSLNGIPLTVYTIINTKNIEHFKYIIKLGANKHKLLHYAVSTNLTAFIDILLDDGMDINLTVDNVQPIYYAIINGNYDMVKYLIENKKDIDLKNNFTNLYSAVALENEKITEYLLSKGADPSKVFMGDNPIFTAIQKNNLNIIRILLNYKINLNIKNLEQITPLMFASMSNSNYKTFKMIFKIYKNDPILINHLNDTNNQGQTALSYSKIDINDTRKTQLLLSIGAI